MPALFTRISTRRNAFFPSEKRRSMSAGLAMFACTATAFPPGLDLGHDLVGALLAGSVIDDDGSAGGGELHGNGSANAFGCPRHDCDLARKLR